MSDLFVKQLEKELEERKEKAKVMGLAEVEAEPLTLVFRIPFLKLPIAAVTALEVIGFIVESFQYHNSNIGNYCALTLPSFDENMKSFIIALVKEFKEAGTIIDANVNFAVHTMLDVSIKYVGQDKVWAKGYKGEKVPLAVLDTGKPEHVDLKDRVVCVKNYVGEVEADRHGHSTHVFGIAAGDGRVSKGKYVGAAPLANLYVGKVLTQDGSGTLMGIVSAVGDMADEFEKLPADSEAPMKDGHRVGVMNLSLGAYQAECHGDCMLCKAVKDVWDRGHFLAIAAGNEGAQFAPLKDYKYANASVCCPARSDGCLSVGALITKDPKNGDESTIGTVAGFSSLGPRSKDERTVMRPHLVAPGEMITSCKMPLSNDPATQEYVAMRGTSMSAPGGAGCAATTWEAHPNWSNDKLREVLMKTAKPLGYKDNYGAEEGGHIEGAGLIQPDRAVAFSDDSDGSAIKGTVTEKESGKPIAGASITIPGNAAVSRDDGSYYMQWVKRGDYVLVCSKSGFKEITRKIYVGEEMTVMQNFKMEKESEDHECPDGEHWDDEQGKCVPDEVGSGKLRIVIDGTEFSGDKVSVEAW